MVLDRDGRGHDGVAVERRVPAGRHRDLAELATGGPVELHVPACHRRVELRRSDRPHRHLELADDAELRHLADAGADPAAVSSALYERRAPDALRFLGESLSRVRVADDGRIAWLALPAGLVPERFIEAEELVNYPRSVASVRVACLLRELNGTVKVSLRGKGDVDVQKIAAQFGGGGHVNAAGCTVPGPLPEATRLLLSAVRRAVDFMPPNASEHGYQIDHIIEFCHWFMGALFVGWSLYFVYVLIRFRKRRHPVAHGFAEDRGRLRVRPRRFDAGGPIQQRVFRVGVQMHETRSHRRCLPERVFHRWGKLHPCHSRVAR